MSQPLEAKACEPSHHNKVAHPGRALINNLFFVTQEKPSWVLVSSGEGRRYAGLLPAKTPAVALLPTLSGSSENAYGILPVFPDASVPPPRFLPPPKKGEEVVVEEARPSIYLRWEREGLLRPLRLLRLSPGERCRATQQRPPPSLGRQLGVRSVPAPPDDPVG